MADATGGPVPRACGEKPGATLSVVATNGSSVVVHAGVTSRGGADWLQLGALMGEPMACDTGGAKPVC